MILKLDTPSRKKTDAGADILPADTPDELCGKLNEALDQYKDGKTGLIVDHGMTIKKNLFGTKTYHRHVKFDCGSLDEVRIGGRHALDTVSLRLTHDVRSVQHQLDLGTEGMSVVMSDRGFYVQRDWKPKYGREMVLSVFDMNCDEMVDSRSRDDGIWSLLTTRSFRDIFDVLQDPVERAFGNDAAWMRNRI